jgi:formate/nitrite transporter FocA (FNT family)
MVAALAAAFLLAGLGLFHSILDSLLIFGALHTDHAPFGYADWLYWFSYTTIGNMVGGIGLVTLLRLVRSKDRLAHERGQVRQQQSARQRSAAPAA